MEESIKTESDNQSLIFLINSFNSAMELIVVYFLLAINLFFIPFAWAYHFWADVIDQSWRIIAYISSNFYEFLKIIPLSAKICVWSVLCCISFLLVMKTNDEINATIKEKIYKKLKKILYILHGLPLSSKHAAALNALLKKCPIFGEGFLPYPDFLFEDTFTDVNSQNGTTSTTPPVPTEPSFQSGSESKPIELSTMATSDPNPSQNQSSASFQSSTNQSSTQFKSPNY